MIRIRHGVNGICGTLISKATLIQTEIENLVPATSRNNRISIRDQAAEWNEYDRSQLHQSRFLKPLDNLQFSQKSRSKYAPLLRVTGHVLLLTDRLYLGETPLAYSALLSTRIF